MDVFYRAQTKGIPFDDMQAYVSADGGDGMEEVGGVCACSSVNDLLMNTVMGAMNDDDEVIVFEGVWLADIYDGSRVRPVREIARYTIADVKARGNDIEV